MTHPSLQRGRIDAVPAKRVELAGVLAEFGIGELEAESPDGQLQTLSARRTDLPGTLAVAPVGTTLRGPGVRVVTLAGSLQWEAADPELATALSRLGR